MNLLKIICAKVVLFILLFISIGLNFFLFYKLSFQVNNTTDTLQNSECSESFTTYEMIECKQSLIDKSKIELNLLIKNSQMKNDQELSQFINTIDKLIDSNCKLASKKFKGGSLESVTFLSCKATILDDLVRFWQKY